ncbi:MAG: hypothetical protein IIA14_03535 [SAR324 cluster bacterium]|nr:hypothetical protein [SAR324 cluster bacterium]
MDGRPCAYWITLFLLCHRRAAGGWERMEWPDGAPLLRQGWLLVTIFRVIREELEQITAEQQRRAGRP